MLRYDPEMKPIIVLALLTAACLVGDSMLYIVLPTHWQDFGLESLWEVGVLLSANRLVRLPLNPLVGWLYKKISTRQGVLLAAALALLTTLAYGFVKGFLPLAACPLRLGRSLDLPAAGLVFCHCRLLHRRQSGTLHGSLQRSVPAGQPGRHAGRRLHRRPVRRNRNRALFRRHHPVGFSSRFALRSDGKKQTSSHRCDRIQHGNFMEKRRHCSGFADRSGDSHDFSGHFLRQL